MSNPVFDLVDSILTAAEIKQLITEDNAREQRLLALEDVDIDAMEEREDEYYAHCEYYRSRM